MSTPPLPPSSLPATSLPWNSPARFLIHTIQSSVSHRQTDRHLLPWVSMGLGLSLSSANY